MASNSTSKPDPLEILRAISEELGAAVPDELLAQVFQIEQRAQFIENRVAAQSGIRNAIGAVLAREELEAESV